MKFEHLYRIADQIAPLADLHREAEQYRQVFNQIRPHEALGMRRAIEIIRDPSLHPIHKLGGQGGGAVGGAAAEAGDNVVVDAADACTAGHRAVRS